MSIATRLLRQCGVIMSAVLLFLPAGVFAAGGKVTDPAGIAPDRYVYYPGTEALDKDEIRIVACGTGMPASRHGQAASCWLIETGNGDKFLFDLGTGSMANVATLMIPYQYLDKVFLSHLHMSLAEGGSTIQTPEGTIDQGNVQQYRERFEARLAIYRAAIEQRGYESFAGNYDATATETCSRAGSAWAGLVAEGAARGVEIVQEGFAIQLMTRFELNGEIQSIETQPVAVESVMTFSDFGNSDYSLVGEIEDGKIVIKPDDRVLDTWPQWANPPKREDLSDCTVTLQVSPDGDASR